MAKKDQSFTYEQKQELLAFIRENQHLAVTSYEQKQFEDKLAQMRYDFRKANAHSI